MNFLLNDVFSGILELEVSPVDDLLQRKREKERRKRNLKTENPKDVRNFLV